MSAGFADTDRRHLLERLLPLERSTTPFAAPPRTGTTCQVHWAEPVLIASIAYRELVAGRTLRQPSYLGLRTDKPRKPSPWPPSAEPRRAGPGPPRRARRNCGDGARDSS
ncbi:hypothetical protein AB0M80_41485 [Amycolatopsis sp. NPDC051045]|uniref:ATP dependent DNA ligase n=1 Tax=Amycolatopsis sp. NPDC051045 TaxID=3156922 RepID=UPI003447EB82